MPARIKARRTIVEMPVEDSTNGWHGASERKNILAIGTFGRTSFRGSPHRIADVLRQGEFRFPASLAANAQAALLPVYVVNGQSTTSPARRPRRASNSKMARSRMPFGAVSHELINASSLGRINTWEDSNASSEPRLAQPEPAMSEAWPSGQIVQIGAQNRHDALHIDGASALRFR